MTQYNTKQGLKHFIQSGVNAIEKEVCQMVTMDALEPDDPKAIRREDCRAMMAYMMLLKEKWYSTIKSQGCYDGRIQRNYMTTEETISPTLMQDSTMVTCAINEMEGRDVAVSNIPGNFIQKDMVHGDLPVRIRICGSPWRRSQWIPFDGGSTRHTAYIQI